MKVPASLIGGAALAAAAVGCRAREDIRGEVAIVTGASRGLGLLLARELARQGCSLVICARDACRTGMRLRGPARPGAEVTAVTCDVTDEAVAAAAGRHGD